MNFKTKFFIISFIEGACVMASEICGAKLLSPFFGSSLYVWSAVMAITLGGLASGYFIGGKLSRGENKQSLLFSILVIAFSFLAIMPFLSNYIYVIAFRFSLIPAVVISTIGILFPCMLLMGLTSPLLVSLLTVNVTDSGLYTGKVYSISTLGGIFSTFLCGFYLIPLIGISYTLLIFSASLALASLLLLKKSKQDLTLFVLIVFAISFVSLTHLPKRKNCIVTQDGILGKIEVVDEKQNEQVSYRKLFVNNILQSEMNLKTKQSTFDYIRVLEKNLPFFPKGKALVMGIGGGLALNMLKQNEYEVVGVEFDERIIAVAKKYFYLNTSIQTICADARQYINTNKIKYDLVMFDVFKAEEQPSYVLTLESLKLIKAFLNPNAILLINTHGYVEGTIGMGTQCLIATLKKSGFNVKICTDKHNPDYRNLLIIASAKQITKTLAFELNFKVEVNDLLNTDDKPVFEKLNAEANQAWRLNYLKNYLFYKPFFYYICSAEY
ncbi:MAG: fused MFS/spermidine synthase [Bacteroidota bacterium]|jgi:predicted membrane-bound spermidine synthase